MIAYDSGQPLVSLHIPKTAGTSFRAVLEGWFGDRLYLHYPAWPIPIGDAPWEAGVCIHGHFNVDRGLGIEDCYPQARQFITIMRDPFERMVSLYRHLRREQAAGLNPTLDGYDDFGAWFVARAEAAAADPLDGFLLNFPRPVTPGGVRGMFDDAFVFVGLTEQMGESVDRLARALDKPAADIGRENTAPEGDADFAGYRARHEQAFPLEHAVYAEARRVFEETGR